MLETCAAYWPYMILTGLIGAATAYWIWGGRKAAAIPEPRVVKVDTPPVAVKKPVAVQKVAEIPEVKVAPIAVAAAVAATAVAAKVAAKPKAKAAPVKKVVAPKPAVKPATEAKPKAAAPKLKTAPVKKAVAKSVVKTATPKPKAAAKPTAKVAAKPAAKVAVKAPVKIKPAAQPTTKPAPKAKAPAKVKAAAKPKIVIPDNLELLKGVGPKLNDLLNSLGVTSFSQVASWNASDIREIDSKLGNFAGRIGRDNWIDQAKLLSKGDVKGFEKKYGPLGSEIKK